MKLTSVALALFAALAVGCSSPSTTENKAPTPDPSSTGTPTDPGTDPGGDTAGTDTTSSGAPAPAPAALTLKAPTIDGIAKMMGGLHVSWTNHQTDCDKVEMERQAQMADGSIMNPYKVVYTLPGEADNKHDANASADMKYTYRLRCKKGADYSPYSNEMSANPKK